jgi:ribonuclease HII
MARGTLDIRARFPGLADSKLLAPKKREELFARARLAVASGDIRYAVAFEDAATIDAIGITAAVQKALDRCLALLAPLKAATHIYLDGLLHAPAAYSQTTIIHGDALIPAISLASVIAKVSRDAVMDDLAREYPQYGFDRHKGYGTPAHYAALAAHGPTPLHRRSFLSRVSRE